MVLVLAGLPALLFAMRDERSRSGFGTSKARLFRLKRPSLRAVLQARASRAPADCVPGKTFPCTEARSG